tara:strand:+ start:331 stop:987 length:657 start_codon:yes stop_codon:yes gene_type:complete
MRSYEPPRAQGTAVKVRIDWDDAALFRALNRMGWRGPDLLHGMLANVADETVEKMKDYLKKKAGPKWNMIAPAERGMQRSESIWKKVSDSLKAVDEPGNTFIRVGSQPYPEGVVGQRGGKLAQIMAGGMKRFRYSPFLPGEVRSSVRWAMKSGQGFDSSRGMRAKKWHPGFKKFNFIAWMQGDIETRYRKEIPETIRWIAKTSGFLLEEDGFGGLGGW